MSTTTVTSIVFVCIATISRPTNSLVSNNETKITDGGDSSYIPSAKAILVGSILGGFVILVVIGVIIMLIKYGWFYRVEEYCYVEDIVKDSPGSNRDDDASDTKGGERLGIPQSSPDNESEYSISSNVGSNIYPDINSDLQSMKGSRGKSDRSSRRSNRSRKRSAKRGVGENSSRQGKRRTNRSENTSQNHFTIESISQQHQEGFSDSEDDVRRAYNCSFLEFNTQTIDETRVNDSENWANHASISEDYRNLGQQLFGELFGHFKHKDHDRNTKESARVAHTERKYHSHWDSVRNGPLMKIVKRHAQISDKACGQSNNSDSGTTYDLQRKHSSHWDSLVEGPLMSVLSIDKLHTHNRLKKDAIYNDLPAPNIYPPLDSNDRTLVQKESRCATSESEIELSDNSDDGSDTDVDSSASGLSMLIDRTTEINERSTRRNRKRFATSVLDPGEIQIHHEESESDEDYRLRDFKSATDKMSTAVGSTSCKSSLGLHDVAENEFTSTVTTKDSKTVELETVALDSRENKVTSPVTTKDSETVELETVDFDTSVDQQTLDKEIE